MLNVAAPLWQVRELQRPVKPGISSAWIITIKLSKPHLQIFTEEIQQTKNYCVRKSGNHLSNILTYAMNMLILRISA